MDYLRTKKASINGQQTNGMAARRCGGGSVLSVRKWKIFGSLWLIRGNWLGRLKPLNGGVKQ